MDFSIFSFSLAKKKSFFKFYKCPRCGYIEEAKVSCPVCKKEGKEVSLK
ncbi:MAG: hypothetical protein JEZ03_05140 [Bacteroidales bacterium]|nr:hypothetical protein [Bacteroidales bacterium]